MNATRFLAIDQGNSFFKLSLFEDGVISRRARVAASDADDIISVADSLRPDCAAFCSVAKIDSRLVESLRMVVGGNLLLLSHATPVPVAIDYATPRSLGIDRVALAVAASGLYKEENLMVVDAGTAVTSDLVSSSGVFAGGRISPGIRLRFESLHHSTAALPLVAADGPLPMVGDSTETSIRAGVVLGLADEVVESFRQYADSFGCSRLLLTGGDAPLIFDRISSRIPAVLVPDLMAMGLLFIYDYNEIN